jgi:hypothetical protein
MSGPIPGQSAPNEALRALLSRSQQEPRLIGCADSALGGDR